MKFKGQNSSNVTNKLHRFEKKKLSGNREVRCGIQMKKYSRNSTQRHKSSKSLKRPRNIQKIRRILCKLR